MLPYELSNLKCCRTEKEIEMADLYDRINGLADDLAIINHRIEEAEGEVPSAESVLTAVAALMKEQFPQYAVTMHCLYDNRFILNVALNEAPEWAKRALEEKP